MGRLEVVLAVLVAQFELREAELLEEFLVPVQGLLLLEVGRAVVAGAFVNRAVGALFPAVQGAVAVGAPVRSWGGTMARSPLRQTAADFAAQLGAPAAIVEVEKIPRGAAMSAATGGREQVGPSTPDRSQRPRLGFQVLGTQLLPVERGPVTLHGRKLGEGSLGVHIEIAVVRMLLAKIIAGWDLGLRIGKKFLKLANQLCQFGAGKFSAQPKDQACYVTHGGWSPRNRASFLNEDSRTETQPLFTSCVKPLPSLSPKLWKLTRCGNRGKIKEPKRFSHCFHSAWKTLRKRRSEFPTVPTASAASFSIKTQQQKPNNASTQNSPPEGEESLDSRFLQIIQEVSSSKV